MSVSTEIVRIQNAKSDIREAIVDKGVSVPGSARVDTYSTYIEQITGGGIQESDVNFYDYDGTLLYAYDKESFAELTELPPNPTHPGLTAQGWNWTLADAQEYVAAYGGQHIGQSYITDDGKTRLYITIEDICKIAYLTYSQSVNGGVVIDWGDGRPTETVMGTSPVRVMHMYEDTGNYVITMIATSGTLTLGGNSASYGFYGNPTSNDYAYLYKQQLRKIELGNVLLSVDCFNRLINLAAITIPTSITSIPNYAFEYCWHLKAIVLPSGLTSIGQYSFQVCKDIEIYSFPKSLTSINIYSFNYNRNNLKCVYLPVGVTFSNSYAFQNCWNLKKVVVPGTTSLPRASFCNDYELEKVIAPNVTSLGQECFSGCNYLDFESNTIDISKVTSMNAITIFQSCYGLKECTINNSVTTLANSLFNTCNGLVKCTLPSTLTNIGTNVFATCNNFKELKVLATTPPTVANTNFLTATPGYQYITVPMESLADYMAATNWTNYKVRFCGIPDTQPQEVEYLYLDGNQSINTHIIQEEIGKISIEMSYDASPTGTNVVSDGVNSTSAPTYNIRLGLRGSEWMVTCSNSGLATDYILLGNFDTDIHTVTLDIINKTGQLDNNDPVSGNINTHYLWGSRAVYVFGTLTGNTGAINNKAAGKRGKIKIWNRVGELVFDAIPVRIGTVGYMYDSVTGYLFPNIGTGDFTVGPDVN